MTKKKTETDKLQLADQTDRDALVSMLEETIMVEAGAGSGKTTSLVKRMVALIAEGKAQTGRIAAVTFTRKAASELRQKFQIALERGLREAQGVKKERLGAAQRDLEQIFIGTIHSFCAQLLRERPVEAGIDPAFTEMAEIDDCIQQNEAWNEYLSMLSYKDDETLSMLHSLDVTFAELKETFHTLVLYPEVEVVTKEILPPKIDDARKEVELFLNFSSKKMPGSVPAGGWDPLQEAVKNAERMLKAFNSEERRDFFKILSLFEKNFKLTLNRWSSPEDAKSVAARLDVLKASTVEPLLKQWRMYRHFHIAGIIQPAVIYCQNKRRESSRLNFQDLLMLASKLLRDKPEVRSYFKERFTHLLIDEFQDTDPIQAEVMLYLTGDDLQEKNWQKLKPGKGSLFVVGDPKQSIYRFRRADIDIYNTVKELILKSGGRLLELKSNFRSVQSIGIWLNPIFKGIFPEKGTRYQAKFSMLETVRSEDVKNISGIRKITTPKVTRNKAETIVEHDSLRIATWIRHALDGNVAIERTDDEKADGLDGKPVPSDFLILLKRKNMIPAYAKRLEELGIPFEVSGGNALNGAEGVSELLKILRAIVEPDSAVDLVSALRGLFFGISDDQLYHFKKAGGRFSFLSIVPKDCPVETKTLFEGIFTKLKTYRDWSRTLPPSVAIEKVIEDLGLVPHLLNRDMGGSQTGNILKLLEYLQQAELSGAPEFYSTVEGLEHLLSEGEMDELDINHGSHKAVRIMNLHKAKGLEAPVVFLANPSGKLEHPPQLHIKRKGDKATGYFVFSHSSKFQDKLIALPPDWDDYEKEETYYEEAEDNRLLYVAGTRAKNLLVVSTYPESVDKSPWAAFSSYLSDISELETIPLNSKKPEILSVKKKDFNEAQKSAIKNIADFNQETYTAITVTTFTKEDAQRPAWKKTGRGFKWGNVIHRLLEAVNKGVTDKDLEFLIANMLIEENLPQEYKDQALSLINEIKKSAFWAELGKASQKFMEVPFSIRVKPADLGLPSTTAEWAVLSGAIDLVYKTKEGWTLVDYKTDDIGTDFDKFVQYYSPQVKAYVRFWEEITGEKVARAGLFFTQTGQFADVLSP